MEQKNYHLNVLSCCNRLHKNMPLDVKIWQIWISFIWEFTLKYSLRYENLMFCWSEKSELKTGCSFKYKRYQGKHVCPKRHVEDSNMTPSIQCSFLERFTHPSRCYSLEKPREICHRFPYKCRKDGGHINFHHSVTRNKKIVNFYG